MSLSNLSIKPMAMLAGLVAQKTALAEWSHGFVIFFISLIVILIFKHDDSLSPKLRIIKSMAIFALQLPVALMISHVPWFCVAIQLNSDYCCVGIYEKTPVLQLMKWPLAIEFKQAQQFELDHMRTFVCLFSCEYVSQFTNVATKELVASHCGHLAVIQQSDRVCKLGHVFLYKALGRTLLMLALLRVYQFKKQEFAVATCVVLLTYTLSTDIASISLYMP